MIRASWPATLAFAGAALRDDHFWTLMAAVREGTQTAEEVARAYARGHAARERLVELVEDLAAAEVGRAEQVALTAGVGTICAFVAAPVPAGLPRNAIQQRAEERHRRGAECILRRGAGLCLSCNVRPRPTGATGGRWPGYADYCSLHGRTEYDRRRDREAIDGVLDELAAKHPAASRSTARRQRRSTGPNPGPSRP